MALFQVIDDGVVMVTMLLPKLTQCITISFLDDQLTVPDLKTLLFESFNNLRLGILLINSEVTFSLMESDIWREHILVFQQCLLDILEWYGLLFFNTDGKDDSELLR